MKALLRQAEPVGIVVLATLLGAVVGGADAGFASTPTGIGETMLVAGLAGFVALVTVP